MLLLFWFALLVADGTPIGRTLRWMLVEVPAGWCNRWSRGDMLLVFTLLAGAALILWLMEAEGRLFLGMLGPDIVAGASMLELGTLLDVAVMAVTVFATLPVQAVRRWVTTHLPRRLPRARKPANDDSDGPVFALAA